MKNILYTLLVVLVCIASCSKKSSPTAEKVIDGAQVFSSNCARCHHYEDPVPGKAPNLAKSDKDKATLVNIITKGHDHMPAFEDKLTTKEIAAVADYLITLRKK